MGVFGITNSNPASRNVHFDIKNTRDCLAMTSSMSDANRRNENSPENAHVVNPGEGKIRVLLI